MSQLARRFGISDVGLAKTCRRHEVPWPPRGYWAKKRSGRKTVQTKLVPVSDPYLEHTGLRLKGPVEREVPVPVDPRVAFEKDKANAIVVSAQLSELHPLAQRALASLQAAKSGENGLRRPRAKQALDIAVSETQIARSVRLMSALITALEARELKVEVVKSSSDQSRTAISVDGQTLYISLIEKVRREDHVPTPKEAAAIKRDPHYRWRLPNHDYIPTGMLTLSVDNACYGVFQRTWSDTPRQRLEDRLNKFVIALYGIAEANRLQEERRAREQREREEQARLAELKRKSEALEKARIDDLSERLALWQEAAKIRQFAAAVETSHAAGALADQSADDLKQWLNWARRYADAIDPCMHPRHPYQEEPPNPNRWGGPPWR
ncbi:hypothetical protein [Salinisphaera hydrothermalis]|uniref:hypothetical protein n=1 Tax=Salinisphaera hydrothermalis TaxID=563188 RepID=UPI000561B840|nr:hypothetical protein [Salinisphaera hydrothermalis]